jgi:hypothetical protein
MKAITSGALVSTVLVLVACDPSRPTDTTTGALSIRPESLWLAPGESAAVSAVDEAGHDVSNLVAWSVGPASPIDLETGSEPMVRAYRHGLTWLRAEYRGARDSIRVTVPFGAAVTEGVAFALGGEDNDTLELRGLTWLYHDLATDTKRSVMTATVGEPDPLLFQDAGLFAADTMVQLVVPGPMEPGTRTLDAWRVEIMEDGGFHMVGGPAGVVVWISNPDEPGRVEMWVPVETMDIQVEESVIPRDEGPVTGTVVGRMAFEAAGLQVQLSEGPARIVGQVSEMTRIMYAEFDVGQRLWPLGYADMSVDGGLRPLQTTRLRAVQNGLYNGAALLHFLTSCDGWLYSSEVRLAEPGVGEFELTPADPDGLAGEEAYSGPGDWSWGEVTRTSVLNETGLPESIAYGTGGTVTVTRYEAPTETTFGRLLGSLVATQDVYTASGRSGVQTVTIDFNLALLPLDAPFFPMIAPVVDSALGDPSHAHLGTGRGVLYGQASEDDQIPVPGVPVTLSRDGQSASVISDEKGDFRFSSLEEGYYTLRFEVPDGHDLARGQDSVLFNVYHPGNDEVRWALIKLSDAEGNGTLQIHAFTTDPDGDVDGVEIRVRREDDPAVAATLVTGTGLFPGSQYPFPGFARSKLQPGRYELDIVLPEGYELPPDAPSPWVVDVYKGHLAHVGLQLVRN